MPTIKKALTINDFKTYKLIYNEHGELKTDLELLLSLKQWRSRIMKKDHLPQRNVLNEEITLTEQDEENPSWTKVCDGFFLYAANRLNKDNNYDIIKENF